MEVTIHHYSALSHQVIWADAFAAGLARHGIKAKRVEGFVPTECDLAVFWGHSAQKSPIMAQCEHYLVMERWYFGPDFKQVSLGFDGLNGQANFLNENSPPDRWEKWGPELKPWNPEGEYSLVVGQVQKDNACNHVNMAAWYDEQIASLDGPVVFRPHPKDASYLVPSGAHFSNNPLPVDLAGAKRVVTFSSTVGVDALIAGKPVTAADSISMVYVGIDREQWAHNLAYCQWSEHEIETGEAWEHLRGLYA